MYPYTVNTVSKGGPTNFYLARAKVCCWSFPLSILTSRSSALVWSCSFSWLQVETYIWINIYFFIIFLERKSVNYGAGVPEQVWVMLFKTNSIPGIYLHVCITSLSNTLYETKCITNFTVWSLTNNTWKIKRHIF